MKHYSSICEACFHAKSIRIKQGKKELVIIKNSKLYQEILTSFESLLEGGHEMPAFSVSLHHETIEEMKKGLWIEFNFDETSEINGLPFSSLLIQVIQSFSGFNLIRQNDGLYQGRCLYYSLNKDMNEWYQVLVKIIRESDVSF